MPDETDRKMMEILRILADSEEVLGAKTIANGLKNKGYSIGERAVRYHMRILDEKGFTERIGYSGRQITDKGLKELEKGLIYDQVDFVYSKFEGMMYQTTLNPESGTGKVVVNTSSFIYDKKIINILKKVFRSGIAVSPYVKIIDNNYGTTKKREVKLETVCGTTIDGMLLNQGIPVIPQYGGLVSIEDYVPARFTELIAYKKTSMTPLEAFNAKDMTSVLQVVEEGTGMVPANFRIIPNSASEKAQELFQKMEKIGISGLLKIGENGESVLGVPVEDDMVGIAIIGGISPLNAANEAGCEVNIKLAENIVDFKEMKKITNLKPIIQTAGPETDFKVKFLLNKAWNLIYNVDFDLNSQKGKVITNISYIHNENLDESLEIMKKVLKNKPEYCTSKYYSIIPHTTDSKLSGIATVCSLTIDGILMKNGIQSSPRYGGILEIEEKGPRFVELTAYSGSSLDSHEIYISKGMTSVLESLEGYGRILSSIKQIPYLARPHAVEILKKIEDSGFSILKVGDPSELVYNAKVERYHAGIVVPGGLNPVAAIKESNIPVDVKSVEALMDLSEMEEF
ncbi:MAG: DUF128 domain-containing protein [Methanomicrobiales archaeon]